MTKIYSYEYFKITIIYVQQFMDNRTKFSVQLIPPLDYCTTIEKNDYCTSIPAQREYLYFILF